MKKNYFTVFVWILTIPILMTLFSYANGYATEKNQGITGAPGDRLYADGNIFSCAHCHTATEHFQASMDIFVTDADGHKILGYAPEAPYKVHFKINHLVNQPTKYGFQAVGILDSDESGLQNFTGYSSNVKEKLGILGRKYYEHNNSSSTNEFTIDWVAPEAGKGSVTFYGVGNAANGDSGQGGDSPCINSFNLTEGLILANDMPIRLREMLVMGNPSYDVIKLSIDAAITERATISLYDMGGHQVLAQNNKLTTGSNQIDFDASQVQQGLYILVIQTKTSRIAQKVLLMH